MCAISLYISFTLLGNDTKKGKIKDKKATPKGSFFIYTSPNVHRREEGEEQKEVEEDGITRIGNITHRLLLKG